MKRRLIGGALLLALACAGLVAYRSDRLLFEFPAGIARHYFEKIGHSMAKHHGLFFLMTFDEPRPQEWVMRGTVQYPGTERVPSPLGYARQFDGRASTHIETSALWPNLGSNYTLSLWVKLEPTGRDQEIWYTFIQAQHTGFKLLDGQLTFFVPGRPEQSVAYPFEAFGRFVHLAGVVDASNGEARLYENGVLKATVPVVEVIHPGQNLEFGKTRLYAATEPFCGALDEAAAWRKALSPKEIRALSRARHSLPRILAAFPYWRWRIAQGAQAAIPAALRMLDRFNPLLHEGRAAGADLPNVYLYFSKKDARHFIRAHDRSLSSGRRTDRSANSRRIHAQYGGKTVAAQLWLDGSDDVYSPGRRPGYILAAPEGAPAFGARRLRLTPPENAESGLPEIGTALANAGVSNAPNGLCRLTIDGQFKGIYLFESFDQRGLQPGERTWVADGPSSQGDWQSIFRSAPLGDGAIPPSLLPADLEERLEQARQLLANDLFHPWSSREWAWRIRKYRSTPLPDPTDLLSPYAILGQNPSPFYVVGDLDLQGLRDKSPDIVWRSSRPDVIDENGKTTRPAGDLPVGVDLVATIPGGDSAQSVPLQFRVMPRDRRLPALMLYVDEPLSGTQRVDFNAVYHPARDEGPARRLAGGQATGGGIKHRGNTSYWRGQKKPFSLRFDEPHRLLGPTNTCHLYLLNGYVDATKLRNKLVYDLFRAFGGEGRPRYAPEIDWTEVFVNGRYFGIYEMCTRIDEDMVGFKEEEVGPAASPVLYKIRPSQTLFAESQTEAFEEVFPSPNKARMVQPLMDLMAITSQADPEKFAREIPEAMDLDNAIDFFLLLNFAGNADGRTTNFFLARAGAPGSRFFFIPWDYDHTFMGHTRWLSNHLFDRLRRESPGFRDRTLDRWNELREGLLSDANLAARIDGLAGHLAGYMDWEYALLQTPVPPTFADHVAELKRSAQAHVDFVDAKLGRTPTPATSAP